MRAQAALAADWIYAHDIVERVRAVKSPAEIDALREAARLTAVGFEAAADALADGVMDTEIASAAYGAIVGNGSERMSIPADRHDWPELRCSAHHFPAPSPCGG